MAEASAAPEDSAHAGNEYAQALRRRLNDHRLQNRYFSPDQLNLTPYSLELFEKYSGIPPDQLRDHIVKIRDEAWQSWPYPCIGTFRFLEFALVDSSKWDQIVAEVKSGATLLDLGCCFGQDLRSLVYAGCPSENLYGGDLNQEFMDLGYLLFKDKDTFKGKFVQGDILTPTTFKEFERKMDIINAGSFLHLFDTTTDVRAASRVIEFLKDKPGTKIVGRQSGTREPGAYPLNEDRKIFRHDPTTWAEFWERIGKATGTKWEVSAQHQPLKRELTEAEKNLAVEGIYPSPESRTWLEFVVTRVE